MSTLHDRLADLATDAPPGGPAPDLWERGRRYQRRRRTGAVVIAVAACLALVGIAALTLHRSDVDVQPAGSQPGLPDRVWAPSPWLPGTDEKGPLGLLAVVRAADRGSWTGSHPGVVGVSATTGEYRYLDLPGLADAWALSPDGRHVAYWTTGSTTRSPNLVMSEKTVAGVAIYDTTNGEVRRHPIATEHGLEPDQLVWSDDGTVLFSYSQILGGEGDPEMDQSSGTAAGFFVWSLEHDGPARLHVPKSLRYGMLRSAGNGVAVFGAGSTYWIVDPSDGPHAFELHIDGGTSGTGGLAVSPDGTQAAGVWNQPNGSNPNQIVVAQLTRSTTPVHPAETDLVTRRRTTFEVVGWLDSDHVVTLRRAGAWDKMELAAVDLHTGERETLTDIGDGRSDQFAADLFDAPTFHAVEPPSPLDSRWAAALVGLVPIGGVWALLAWRRRVEP